ncbi:MAG: tetratricopeptide repeat protein [Casimicrobiaceae bacterium]
MRPYGVRDVERLLRLSRSTIRSLIASGFVAPARGPRGAWQFSFQDLIVLRTAQALADAKVPQRRITRSMRELRRHLPDAMPLSGLRISAVADRVVVREGGSRWQAESGQYLLGFDSNPADGSLSVIERNEPDAAATAQQWFEQGVTLEREDVVAALQAYAHAIAADSAFLDARINLGRLLHGSLRFAEAERVYGDAVKAGASDPVLHFNLGVLYEDMDRAPEAMQAYEAALRADPDMADCHYNLALLCEKLAQPKEAIRHMARYRVLVGGRPK